MSKDVDTSALPFVPAKLQRGRQSTRSVRSKGCVQWMRIGLWIPWICCILGYCLDRPLQALRRKELGCTSVLPAWLQPWQGINAQEKLISD